MFDLAICSYAGNGHSELGMLCKSWDVLPPGDVMLADRYMCAWHETDYSAILPTATGSISGRRTWIVL